MSDGFLPTHVVPPSGIGSWPRPDAQAPAGPRIDGGLDVQVTDRMGDWAKVVFSNGWSAWVDGRTLVAKAGESPATPRAAGGIDLAALTKDRPKAIALGGAGVAAVGALLPWVRGGLSGNAFDVSIKFLADYKTQSTGGLKVGLLLIGLAVATVAALLKAADVKVLRLLGFATAAVAALFVVQFQRLASAGNASLADVLGPGPIITVVGGLAIAFAPRLAARFER